MVGKCATRPPVPPHLCATLPLRVTLPPVPWDERLEESSDGSSWFPIFGHVSFIQCVCIYIYVCVSIIYIYSYLFIVNLYIYISLGPYPCMVVEHWCESPQFDVLKPAIKSSWLRLSLKSPGILLKGLFLNAQENSKKIKFKNIQKKYTTNPTVLHSCQAPLHLLPVVFQPCFSCCSSHLCLFGRWHLLNKFP